jgi:Flp pilus assembly pilin Flp
MAYVVSYVVPFAAATDDSGATRAALGVFAALIAVQLK